VPDEIWSPDFADVFSEGMADPLPALQVPRMPNNESGNIAQRGVGHVEVFADPEESRGRENRRSGRRRSPSVRRGFQTLAWLDKEWEGRRQEDNGPDAELFHWPASLLVKDTSLNVNRPVRKRVLSRRVPSVLAQDPPTDLKQRHLPIPSLP